MTTTNLTGSDVNGVYNITATSKPAVDGGADTEGILITGSGLLQASKTDTTEIILTYCNIFCNNAGNTGGNPSLSHISYNGDDTDRADNGNYIRFRDCNIIQLTSAARRNIFVSELTRTNVIEQDSGSQLFVYTQPNAILNTVIMQGVQTWEINGQFTEAFNITIDDVLKSYLNWEAGRLDLFGLGVLNKPAGAEQADAWMGTGNSGNNASWQWNNKTTFNNQKLYLTSVNNRYYDGMTISWEFIDKDTDSAIQNVKVKVKDDFPGVDNGGSMTERAEYLTNASGHIKGTWNSQLRSTTGGDIDRNTYFMVRNAVERVDTNPDLGGTKTYPVTIIEGGQGDRGENYEVDVVLNQIEIKAYLYEVRSGFEVGDSFDTSVQIGVLASDVSVDEYSTLIFTPDAGITQTTKATVDAYTTLDDLNEIYDRTKAEWYDNDAYPLPTKTDLNMNVGSANLLIDGTAGAAFAYASGPDTITAKGTTVSATANFTTIVVTDLTLDNGAIIDGVNVTGDVTLNEVIDMDDMIITGDLTLVTAGTYNFSNVTVTGDVTNSGGGAITIALSNGSSMTTSEPGTGNGEVNIVNTVPIKVIVKDAASLDLLEGARVLLEADTGGDLPSAESVTITRVTTTATVVHTGHGMTDGTVVDIVGAVQPEYNGQQTITFIDANSYSYTVSGSPTSPATGTITATAQIVNDVTDGVGEVNLDFNYTSDQPITGRVRKSTL